MQVDIVVIVLMLLTHDVVYCVGDGDAWKKHAIQELQVLLLTVTYE